MNIESLDFLTILFKILEMSKYLKHLHAPDDHHCDVDHSKMIDSVQLIKFDL
jgi:hypothetical protein